MSKKIITSLLTKADAKTLRDIAILEIAASGRVPGKEEIEARTQRLAGELEKLDTNKKGIFVAKKSKEIIGIGRIEKMTGASDSWMLYGIVVHPEHRRQGIGEMLAQACVTFAKEHDAKTICSEAHADNLTSIAFHKSIGFVEGRRFITPDGDKKIAFSMEIGDKMKDSK